MKMMKIDGNHWTDMIKSATAYLEVRKSVVDALNVFPIPDGDTGTNMSLTLHSASRSMDQVSVGDRDHFGQRSQALAQGALLGARGNSGVILSQILSGFSTVCESEKEVDGELFLQGLDIGVKAACTAVMKPVKGTILTVSEAAVTGGRQALGAGDADFISILESAVKEALTALELTPTMLPILKQAGVVDAGGQGFLFIIEAFLACLKGEKPESDELIAKPVFTAGDDIEDFEVEDEFINPEDLTYVYCTEFVIKNKDIPIEMDDIRDFLTTLGDCVLVVGSPSVCKVHVHTNEPGKVLSFVTGMGSLHKMKIDNMREEMEKKERLEVKKIGLIAVANGQGLEEIFRSLGAHRIITGGQTMNPSAQDFVDAMNSLSAREIIILPNNSNIILAAGQAAKMSKVIAHVTPTKSMLQGIGAMLAFDEGDTGGENLRKMTEAAGKIVTLELTQAVRDTTFDDKEIKKGQILGIADGKLLLTADDLREGAINLVKRTIKPEHELVTVYFGQDASEEDTEELCEQIAGLYDYVDIEYHSGGQPLYYYLISLE